MEKEYKIYVLKHPLTKEVRYVGVTTRKLNERLSQHLCAAKKRCNTRCNKWIKSLLDQELKPEMLQIDIANEANWEVMEQNYIQLYKSLNSKLVNHNKGGKGVILNRLPEGKIRSAVAKFKPVCQCDKNYNLIKVWESVKTAAETLNISRGSIYKCLEQRHNTNPTAGNFRWIKKDLFDTNSFLRKSILPKQLYSKYRNVIKKDSLGNVIKVYASVTDFAKEIGMRRDTVYSKAEKSNLIILNDYIYEIKESNKI